MNAGPDAVDAESTPLWARAPAALVALLAAAVFGPAVAAGYVWDDVLLVSALPPPGSSLASAVGLDLAAAGLRAEGGASGYFRPLLLLGLWAERAFGAAAPAVGHVHSLLWHLVAIAGLDRWARVQAIGPAGRLLALVIFGLHPMQVEPVVWISARPELMLSAVALWSLALASPARRGALAVLGVLAALSKDQGAVLPLALALQGGWRAAVPASAGVAFALGLRAWAGVGVPPASLGAALDVLPTLAQISARDLLVPIGLHPGEHLGYSPPPPHVPALVLAGLVLVGARVGGTTGRAGLALAAAAWAPSCAAVGMLGLVGLRYHHLALAGLGLAAGAAADRWLHPAVARGLGLGLALIFAGLGAAQLPKWASDQQFWHEAVQAHPNPYTWAGRGIDRWTTGDREGAVADLRTAAAGPRPLGVACDALGPILLDSALQTGGWAQAAQVGLDPQHAGCRGRPSWDGAAAVALVGAGELDQAVALASALSADPHGYGLLVHIAAEADAGRDERLRTVPVEARGLLAEQAAALLDAGGRPTAAARLRAQAAGR